MKCTDSSLLDPFLVSKVLCETTVLGIDVLVVTADDDLQIPRCRLFFDDKDADNLILRVSKKYVLPSHDSIGCRFTAIDSPFFSKVVFSENLKADLPTISTTSKHRIPFNRTTDVSI